MYSECVAIAKIIHLAKRVNGIILLFVAYLALHFSALSHKRHDFWKESYCIQQVCFDFIYKFCPKHFSL
jgi:hypothetical protein